MERILSLQKLPYAQEQEAALDSTRSVSCSNGSYFACTGDCKPPETE